MQLRTALDAVRHCPGQRSPLRNPLMAFRAPLQVSVAPALQGPLTDFPSFVGFIVNEDHLLDAYFVSSQSRKTSL